MTITDEFKSSGGRLKMISRKVGVSA